MLNKLLGFTIVGSGRSEYFLIFLTKTEENKFSSKEMMGVVYSVVFHRSHLIHPVPHSEPT